MLCCRFCVLGHLAPVHRCARSVSCAACALSWATCLLFTGVYPPRVVLHVWCPRSLGSCSPVCTLAVLCCACGVLGELAPAHRRARWACRAECAVSWASWLLFIGVYAARVVLPVQCPGPLGSCSPPCTLGVLCCVCRVLGHLAPVHCCAHSACCTVFAVFFAPWLLFTGVHARRVMVRVRSSGPLGSCSPVCTLGVLCCVCSVLGYLAPVQRYVRSACCAVCAVFCATWLLFTGVHAWYAVLRVPGIAAGRAHVHTDGGSFVAGRGSVPLERALVHPDGGCSVARRSWIPCRARTRPSGWQLVGCWSWPGQAGRPLGCVLVRSTVLAAVLLFFWPPRGCVCPWFILVLFLAPPLRLFFRCFRPQVLWALALCLSPLVPFLFLLVFSAPPLSPLCRWFGRLVSSASELCGCPPPPLLPFLFFAAFFAPPLFPGSRPSVPLASAPPDLVSFSSLVCGLACGVCAVRWCCAPPPPGGYSWCFVVSRVLLC